MAMVLVGEGCSQRVVTVKVKGQQEREGRLYRRRAKFKSLSGMTFRVMSDVQTNSVSRKAAPLPIALSSGARFG